MIRRGAAATAAATTAAATALLGLAAVLIGCRPSGPKNPFGYRQLTSAGEAGSPSLSRDGRFVAYVSDQGEPGNLDIWIQPVAAGTPTRLTSHPARDYDPVFSADGKSVFFTSLREAQGIYRVPVSGGEAQLVVRGGLSPELSPDGGKLAFVATTGNLAVLTLADGLSHPLLEGFYSSYAPKWSPDGKEILFAGKATKDDEVEWWIVASDGGSPRNTGIVAALRQRGFIDAFAQAWLPGDEIVFAGKQADHLTLWRFKLSADRQLAGDPVRATDDDSGDFRASYAAGHLVFERTHVGLNLWSLPVDANQGRVTGNPQRLTSSDAQKGSAALSRDGRTLLYSAEQQGTFRLVLKDLTSGREKNVGPSSYAFYSVLNSDGSRYLYGGGQSGAIDVFTRAVHGWRSWWSQTICNHCGMPRGVSLDGNYALVWADADPQNHLDLVDLRTGKPRVVLQHWTDHLYGPELSPDGGWISFVLKTGENSFRSYIARIPEQGMALDNDWIEVNPSSHEFQMVFWSPDGNLLYILSEHGEGNMNWLEAQRLDAQSKRPQGAPFAVYHFKEPRVPTMDPIWNHPAAADGRIVLELGDMTRNVWIMDAPR